MFWVKKSYSNELPSQLVPRASGVSILQSKFDLGTRFVEMSKNIGNRRQLHSNVDFFWTIVFSILGFIGHAESLKSGHPLTKNVRPNHIGGLIFWIGFG